MEIRTATADEMTDTMFALWDEENDGNLLVVDDSGAIVAFCQHNANDILFLESNVKGAGTMLVNYIIAEYGDEFGEIVAKNVTVGKHGSNGYWEKLSFEQLEPSRERHNEWHYVLYLD